MPELAATPAARLAIGRHLPLEGRSLRPGVVGGLLEDLEDLIPDLIIDDGQALLDAAGGSHHRRPPVLARVSMKVLTTADQLSGYSTCT